MPSDCAPVACFASVHGLNSFPTYILVFTISSRCLLRYLFHFLVESDRFHFKIVHRNLFTVTACRKVEARGRHVSRASRDYLPRFQQPSSKHILGLILVRNLSLYYLFISIINIYFYLS